MQKCILSKTYGLPKKDLPKIVGFKGGKLKPMDGMPSSEQWTNEIGMDETKQHIPRIDQSRPNQSSQT